MLLSLSSSVQSDRIIYLLSRSSAYAQIVALRGDWQSFRFARFRKSFKVLFIGIPAASRSEIDSFQPELITSSTLAILLSCRLLCKEEDKLSFVCSWTAVTRKARLLSYRHFFSSKTVLEGAAAILSGFPIMQSPCFAVFSLVVFFDSIYESLVSLISSDHFSAA